MTEAVLEASRTEARTEAPHRPRPLLDAAQLRVCMPETASFLRGVLDVFGADIGVAPAVRAAIALRQAVDADDFELVNALYRQMKVDRVHPMHAVEGGWQLGAAEAEVIEFARRHRAQRRAVRG